MKLCVRSREISNPYEFFIPTLGNWWFVKIIFQAFLPFYGSSGFCYKLGNYGCNFLNSLVSPALRVVVFFMISLLWWIQEKFLIFSLLSFFLVVRIESDDFQALHMLDQIPAVLLLFWKSILTRYKIPSWQFSLSVL